MPTEIEIDGVTTVIVKPVRGNVWLTLTDKEAELLFKTLELRINNLKTFVPFMEQPHTTLAQIEEHKNLLAKIKSQHKKP